MNRILNLCAVLFGLLVASAHATGGSCEAQATDKKLAGAAKTSFLKKCETDTATKACDVQTTEKKLAGAAKSSFLKKCVADSKPAGKSAKETCDSQAADKKLAGAAKDSFVKKCIADAG
jgi:hypothetical protein